MGGAQGLPVEIVKINDKRIHSNFKSLVLLNIQHKIMIMLNFTKHLEANTVGQFSITWFNNCVLGNSGQITNPIIVKVDPIPYYSIRVHSCLRIY